MTVHIRWNGAVAARLLQVLFVGISILSTESCSKRETDEKVAVRIQESGSSKNDRQNIVLTSNVADISVYLTTTSGTSGAESLVFQNRFLQKNGYCFFGDVPWPAQGGVYHFYGSNVPTEYHSGGTCVWADGSQDVVCAYLASPTWGAVNVLLFKHIMGRIGSATLSIEEGWTVSDVSVTISAVTGGTFDIRAGYGHDDGTGWKDKVHVEGFSVVPESAGTVDIGAYLVPGVYQVTASWRAAKGSISQQFTDMSSSLTIVAGESQDISVTLGGIFMVNASVSPWDGTVNISEES